MRLEGFAQVLDVDIKNVLYTKIFNSEDEEDGAPFVAPKSRGGGGLVFINLYVKESFEEIVGEHSRLG